jgi:hypothetical protein
MPRPQPQLTAFETQLQFRYRQSVQRACARPSAVYVAIILIVSLAFAATIIGIPVSYILLRRTFGRNDTGCEERLAFAEQAVPVMAHPLMVNSALRKPAGISAPGLVIISFDRAAQDDPGRMPAIALRLLELSLEDPASGTDAAYANDLFADEEYQPHRRRKLPASLSGDLTVYACDLMIHQALLHKGFLDEPHIPCMATPGDTGRIEMIPHKVMDSAVLDKLMREAEAELDRQKK